MNIAIVLGVSKYNGASDLPGCEADAREMGKILSASGKFKKILTISDTLSANVKAKITELITEFKGKEVTEFLFYFSGHGEYYEEEFYYILTDFDRNKRNQTSLKNSEVDNLIKSLNPELVTKLVDSCHSGITYVKNNNTAIDSYIKSTRDRFNNCYFMFSSLNSQSSYQNSDYSFFTLSLLNAIKNSKSDDVRYKDIIDYISDEFSQDQDQTPFFVTQANYTELFCTKNKQIANILESIPATFQSSAFSSAYSSVDDLKSTSLEKIIEEDSKLHLSFEDVCDLLEHIRSRIESWTLDNEIANLFQLKPSFSERTRSSNIDLSLIGHFVKGAKDVYFATPTYETEMYMDTIRPSVFDRRHGNSEPYQVEKEREIVSGYRLNVNYPYTQIHIRLHAKYQNTNDYLCAIYFITSDRKIRFYTFITNYLNTNWEDKKLNTKFDWIFKEMNLIDRELIDQFLNDVQVQLSSQVKDELKRQFELDE